MSDFARDQSAPVFLLKLVERLRIYVDLLTLSDGTKYPPWTSNLPKSELGVDRAPGLFRIALSTMGPFMESVIKMLERDEINKCKTLWCV